MRFTALSKRLVILLVASCYLLVAGVSPAYAQQTIPNTQTSYAQPNPYLAPNTNPDVPKDLNTLTNSVLINLMGAMICQISGINVTNQSQACLGVDPSSGNIGFVQDGNGAIGVMGSLIAATYIHPPASTGDYFAYMGSKFGIVEPTYAQAGGTGLTGISPMVKIWELFRNITYLLFVIVFVVVGFAIMLRVKIDPRTVMTIQNSIPKIIIALVLVTLSFAIAGFLIDMMYVTINLVFNLFKSLDITPPGFDTSFKITNAQKTVYTDSPLGVFNNLVGYLDIVSGSAGSVKTIVQEIFGTAVSSDPTVGPSAGIPFISGLANIFAWAGDVFRNAFGALLGWIGGVLAFLIIAVAVLFSLFRLWFQLIMAYVTILINIIFAPFWIIAGVLPASPVSFSAWLREMIATLSVFPTTIFLFILAKLFMDVFVASGQSGAAFVPPLIGGNNAGALGGLIGLGFILMTPQVTAMVKEALKAPKFPYGAAIGQAIGTGPGIVGAGVGALTNPFNLLGQITAESPTGAIGAFRRWSRSKGQQTVKPLVGTGTQGTQQP